MPSVFLETSERKADLITQFGIWNRSCKLRKGFDSSGGYRLANGFRPSPDVSWIQNTRLAGVSLKQFLTIAPDFVIELRSDADRLLSLQQKMWAYLDNGVRLGLLFNPQDQAVELYRLGQESMVLSTPTEVSGEDVLPGFTLDLTSIW